MELLLPEIREEAFKIRTSVKNIKKMHAYQLDLVKSGEALEQAQDGSVQEFTKAITLDDANTIDKAEKFIVDILGLSKKEVEKLEDFERADFMNLQSKIVLTLQGYGDVDINNMFSEENEDAEKKEVAPVND